jgi:hypothetical protein
MPKPQTLDQAAKDASQAALQDAAIVFAEALQKLHKTNPCPEHSALDQAVNLLATELWNRRFSVTEIAIALSRAAADLPRYAAAEDVRL